MDMGMFCLSKTYVCPSFLIQGTITEHDNITRFPTSRTRWETLGKQDLLVRPERMSSLPSFIEIRVAQSYVVYMCFIAYCLLIECLLAIAFVVFIRITAFEFPFGTSSVLLLMIITSVQGAASNGLQKRYVFIHYVYYNLVPSSLSSVSMSTNPLVSWEFPQSPQ